MGKAKQQKSQTKQSKNNKIKVDKQMKVSKKGKKVNSDKIIDFLNKTSDKLGVKSKKAKKISLKIKSKYRKGDKVSNTVHQLKNKLRESFTSKKPPTKTQTLRERMVEKLRAARFRYLNEQIYTQEGHEAKKLFDEDADAFKAYHEGYQQQVARWPLNPLDVIIDKIHKMPSNNVVADLGCGEARLAASVKQKVHSFDLVAVNESVTACDMAHLPLDAQSVDIVVFSLSLMGTNLRDYLLEANRILKLGGVMLVAEVESRFDRVSEFIEGVEYFGFKHFWKDLSHNLFYFIDFKKENNIRNKHRLPTISLHPCLYKKR